MTHWPSFARGDFVIHFAKNQVSLRCPRKFKKKWRETITPLFSADSCSFGIIGSILVKKSVSQKTLKIVFYVKNMQISCHLTKKLKFWPQKHYFHTEITCGNDSSHKIYPMRDVFVESDQLETSKIHKNLNIAKKIIFLKIDFWPRI